MGRRREQRREERATFGRGGTATRYRMRQKLVAFGDDFWIENEAGQRAFKVDGKMPVSYTHLDVYKRQVGYLKMPYSSLVIALLT